MGDYLSRKDAFISKRDEKLAKKIAGAKERRTVLKEERKKKGRGYVGRKREKNGGSRKVVSRFPLLM